MSDYQRLEKQQKAYEGKNCVNIHFPGRLWILDFEKAISNIRLFFEFKKLLAKLPNKKPRKKIVRGLNF